MQGDRQELSSLLRQFRTGLLITRGEDGQLHARPMAMSGRVRDDELWFVSSIDSRKCRDIEADPRCAIAFHKDESDLTYVSISGTAEIVRDKSLIHRLWATSWRAWFPAGPEQDGVVLIKVRPEHVEYVHPSTGRLKVLYSLVKQIVARAPGELAQKKELDLH